MSEITRIDLPSARHGAAMARHGRPPSPAPATRPAWFSRITASSAFLARRPPDIPSGANQPPRPCFSRDTSHETRITKHESRLLRFSRCFPASCGAAWGGYGAAWAAASPAPATRPVWLSRITRHETRITAFFRITASLPTISHDFPPFPGISHHFPAPPPPSAVLGRPRGARRQPPLPPPTGKHENGPPREHDSNVNL